MNYSDQWKALSGRIRGLMQAGQLHAHYLAVRSSDPYGIGRGLREQSEGVLAALVSFRDQFQQSLSQATLNSLDMFIEKIGGLIRDATGGPDSKQERVWAILVLLAAFEAEMSFLLSDVQESIRARSERAFSHLQRLIVADATVREKWQESFKKGEVACEKLGAVHLLLHGIWAFKVDAIGGRTDLVFQEPAGDLSNAQRYVDGFVLTEWKKANPNDNVGQLFEQARLQARRYSQGALAGSELTSYRFAIVVSHQQIDVPNDLREGLVIYRHINIAVNPRLPSRV
jgi:hypothetical protein